MKQGRGGEVRIEEDNRMSWGTVLVFLVVLVLVAMALGLGLSESIQWGKSQAITEAEGAVVEQMGVEATRQALEVMREDAAAKLRREEAEWAMEQASAARWEEVVDTVRMVLIWGTVAVFLGVLALLGIGVVYIGLEALKRVRLPQVKVVKVREGERTLALRMDGRVRLLEGGEIATAPAAPRNDMLRGEVGMSVLPTAPRNGAPAAPRGEEIATAPTAPRGEEIATAPGNDSRESGL